MLSETKSHLSGRTLIHTLFFFLLVTQICFAQWVQTSLDSCYVTSFAVSETNLFTGTIHCEGFPCADSVFLSTDNGTSWNSVNSGLPYTPVRALAVSGINLFAGTGVCGGGEGVRSSINNSSSEDGVFLSTNNGTSWTAVNNGLTNGNILALAISGTNLFAGTWGGGVYRSTDNGTNWNAVNDGLTGPYVRAFAVSGTNLFAGTEWDGVFLSTNDGSSWVAVNGGLPLYRFWVVSFAVSGANLFAGTNYGVFLSTDSGTSWNVVNSGLPGTPVVSSLCASGANLFAGTEGHGVFLSTNNGASWNAVNTGLMDSIVSVLAVSGTYLFTGTYFSGVWRRPLSEMITDVEDFEQLPIEFSLSQNYPNPFNPSTKIKYSIPPVGTQHAVSVQLKVYDVLGNEIETLVNEEKLAGTYEITWYAENLPSGVCFYQIKAGSFIETKKMLLLK